MQKKFSIAICLSVALGFVTGNLIEFQSFAEHYNKNGMIITTVSNVPDSTAEDCSDCSDHCSHHCNGLHFVVMPSELKSINFEPSSSVQIWYQKPSNIFIEVAGQPPQALQS